MVPLPVHIPTPHLTVIPHGESSRVVAEKLNLEWEQCKDAQPTWSTAPDLDTILETIRFNPDLVLGELIDACQQGSSLAGRCIVQALLPKLILLSRSNPYPPLDHMVAALWIRISRYSLEKRPRSIAANLVLDARKDALGEYYERGVLPLNQQDLSDPVSADAIINNARTLGLASLESLTIMEKIYLDGLPSARVAEQFNMTPEAVRRRCSDTISRLRKHRVLLSEMCFD